VFAALRSAISPASGRLGAAGPDLGEWIPQGVNITGPESGQKKWAAPSGAAHNQ